MASKLLNHPHRAATGLRFHIGLSKSGKWRLRRIVNGQPTGDTDLFTTLRKAVDAATGRLRIQAVQDLLAEVVAVPGEYHGIAGRKVTGRNHERKMDTLANAALYRGYRVHVAHDDDADGNRDYYVQYRGPR